MKVTSLLVFCSLIYDATGAKILALFPFLGESHFIMFRCIIEELNRRGHELVVVTPFPLEKPLENYREISLRGVVPYINNEIEIGIFSGPLYRNPIMDLVQLYWLLGSYEDAFRLKQVQEVISGREKFDLILTELFNTDMFLGVPFKLGVPFIALSSCTAMPWSYGRFGNPDSPVIFDGTFSTGQESFLQRLGNTLGIWICKAAYTLFFDPYSQRVAEKYLGPLPPLSEIAKNTSLFLLNTHHSLHKSRPHVPAVVEVGGIHIPPAKKLPQDLEKFLNSSKEGVIYFSMGSVLRGETWPEEKRKILFQVFSKLKQNVLWKWEGDDLPVKSKNILTMKWIPQRDVLEHPNVLLYIAHGGLFGITEAVHCGVPILGIPVFGDQSLNIQAVIRGGAGLSLDIDSFDETKLSQAINKLIYDTRYRENARELSRRFRDRPSPPMDEAMYWIEYVIRHNGARHLRSAAADLPTYQYFLVDIILFIGVSIISFLLVVYCVVKFIFRKMFGSAKTEETKTSTKYE